MRPHIYIRKVFFKAFCNIKLVKQKSETKITCEVIRQSEKYHSLKGCFGLDRNSNEKAFYPYKEAAMLLIKISISKFLRERSRILIIILIHSIMISMKRRVMKINLMKMRVGNERLMESDIAKRYCQPMQPSSLSTSSSTSSSSSSSSSPSSSCDNSEAS